MQFLVAAANISNLKVVLLVFSSAVLKEQTLDTFWHF